MKKYIAILLVVVIVVGIVFAGILHGRKEKASDNEHISDLPPLVVTGTIVKRGDIVQYVEAVGIVKSEREVEYVSPINTRVKYIGIEEGSRVKKGELLLKLDDPITKAKLEKAKLELNKCRKKYEFARDHNWGDTTLLKTTTGLNDALINYLMVKKLFDKVEIHAPFNGVVSGVNVSKGSLVNANEKLFDLIDDEHSKILVDIPGIELKGIKRGRKAIIWELFSDKKSYGVVRYVSPVINEETKTGQVTVISNTKFRIGTHLNVKIVNGEYHNRIRVPNRAILYREGKYLVFTVKDGKANWQWIKKGIEGADYTEVLEGISVGDTVITKGQFTISHGADVSVKIK